MRKQAYPYLVLIACCLLVSIVYGFVNIQGLFFDYISEDLNVGKGSVSFYVTIIHVVGSLCGPIGVSLREKLSVRKTLIIIGTLVFGALMFIPHITSLWQLYICATIMGLGQGVYGFVLVTFLLNKMFSKAGTLSGIAISFSGVFATVFSPIIVNRIVEMGWRRAYYIFPILFVIGMAFAILIINEKPIVQVKEKKEKFKYADSLVLAIAFYYIIGAAITLVCQHLLGYGKSIGLSIEQCAVLTSAIGIGNLVLKLAFGSLTDITSGIKAILINFVCIMAGLAIMIFANSNMFILIVIGVILVGSSFSVGNVLVQALCRDVYGKEKVATTYASLTLLALPYAFGSTAIGFVYDLTSSYKVSLVGFGVLLTISIALLLIVYKKRMLKK